MVIDLDSSSTSSVGDLNVVNYPPKTGVYKDKIYFTAYSLTLGERIWVSDGTVNGTNSLLDANNNYFLEGTYFTVLDSILYFFAGGKLNRTDGTQQGTYALYNPVRPFSFTTTPNLETNFLWEERLINSQVISNYGPWMKQERRH